MKSCFDTSVLVPALLREHPQHSPAFARLLAVQKKKLQGYLTTHAVAEAFATLTALPLKPRLQPAETQRMLQQSVLSCFNVIPLTAKHYSDALDLTVRQGFSSGAVYDALHLVGARAAGCDELLTFKLRHFKAFAPDDPIFVQP